MNSHVEKNFNSHPHEEDDKAGIEKQKQMEYFNSHPHEEDDPIAQKGR